MGPPPEAGQPLTPRELEVLALLCQGLTLAQIGKAMGVTFTTVNGHTKAIYRKLNVCCRSAGTCQAGYMVGYMAGYMAGQASQGEDETRELRP